METRRQQAAQQEPGKALTTALAEKRIKRQGVKEDSEAEVPIPGVTSQDKSKTKYRTEDGTKILFKSQTSVAKKWW